MVEFFVTLDGQVHFHALTQAASGFGGFKIDRRTPPLSIREMDDGIAEHLAEKHGLADRRPINEIKRPAAE